MKSPVLQTCLVNEQHTNVRLAERLKELVSQSMFYFILESVRSLTAERYSHF